MDEKAQQEQEELQERDRRIQEEESSTKESKNILIIMGVIVGLFVLVFVGVSWYSGITGGGIVTVDQLHEKNLNGELDREEAYVYNGFSFVKNDGLWWTELNKFGTRLKVPLHYGPRELENVSITGTFDPRFNDGETAYVAIDPDVYNKYYTLGVSELSFNMVKGMDRVPLGSCTKQGLGCENRTIISCQNASGKPVVELVLTDEAARVELQETCIKISGAGSEIVRAVDRILYQWYGVMKQ